ncbi:TetR/AcrR family transcriptional regulator [Tamaricihabitans halophyticus]|uniref:TetR/AcrR family transcriptional regulator n=1 Tax=Tamaricihabitans halophyticus TaxID=1262583 RepID=UPI001FB2CE59|nr:TetR/AcrR family transcriptional regulator [Tamaricihabitans halophyticus]
MTARDSDASRAKGVAGQIWLRDQPATSRENPPLTRDRIVQAAIELLDEHGVGKLTMRRLADHLDAGTTTLYWHVRTKDDVLDLALDAVFGEVDLAEQDLEHPACPADQHDGGDGGGDHAADWARIRALLQRWRAALLGHPWSAAILGRPLLGPNVLTRQESLYRALARAGIPATQLQSAAYCLANFVIGSTMMEAAWQLHDAETARAAVRARIASAPDAYPALAIDPPLSGSWETTFDQGLGYILRGLAAESA